MEIQTKNKIGDSVFSPFPLFRGEMSILMDKGVAREKLLCFNSSFLKGGAEGFRGGGFGEIPPAEDGGLPLRKGEGKRKNFMPKLKTENKTIVKKFLEWIGLKKIDRWGRPFYAGVCTSSRQRESWEVLSLTPIGKSLMGKF